MLLPPLLLPSSSRTMTPPPPYLQQEVGAGAARKGLLRLADRGRHLEEVRAGRRAEAQEVERDDAVGRDVGGGAGQVAVDLDAGAAGVDLHACMRLEGCGMEWGHARTGAGQSGVGRREEEAHSVTSGAPNIEAQTRTSQTPL